MALEYRHGRTAYGPYGEAIVQEEAGTYDTATGAWVSPFNLLDLGVQYTPAQKELLVAHGSGREAGVEALVSSAMLGADRLSAAIAAPGVAAVGVTGADAAGIFSEGQRRAARQREIDAGAGDDFDFGSVIMAGLVAGIGYLSGGFGLSELFKVAQAAPVAVESPALQVLDAFPAEGTLYEGVAYEWTRTPLQVLDAFPAEGTLYEGTNYSWPSPGAPSGLSVSGSAPAAAPGAAETAISGALGKLAPAGLAAALKAALGDVKPLPTTAEEVAALNTQQWVALGLMGAAAIGAVYLVTSE